MNDRPAMLKSARAANRTAVLISRGGHSVEVRHTRNMRSPTIASPMIDAMQDKRGNPSHMPANVTVPTTTIASTAKRKSCLCVV
jgi:hypothetical protein